MKALALCALVLLARPCLGAEPPALDPLHAHDNEPIRVACLGASVTRGVGAAPHESYPDQLQALLGPGFVVRNFGVSGRTLLSRGDHPYSNEKAFADAQTFNPDVVIILLGGNDTKPQNWVHHDEFIADYKSMIETFKGLPSKPRIFICRPTPVPEPGNYGINETNLQIELPMIDQVAATENVGLIDMHAALAGHPELLPDRVHPNTAGAALLAQAAAKALTAK